MKAREVFERCNKKADPEIVTCMVAIAEKQSVMRQQIMGLAMQMDQMADIIGDFTTIASDMKETIDSMKKIDPNVEVDSF